jgi:hypothetical protein
LTETSLPLAGTLLTVALNPQSSAGAPGPAQTEAASQSQSVSQAGLNVALLPGASLSPSSGQSLSTAASETAFAVSSSSPANSAPSLGQSLLGPSNQPETSGEGESEPGVKPESQGSSIWSRFLPGVDEVFDQIREEIRASERGGDAPEVKEETGPASGGEPVGRPSPSPPAAALDEAIDTLWAAEPEHAPPIRPAFPGAVALWTPLVLSGIQAAAFGGATRKKLPGFPLRRR